MLKISFAVIRAFEIMGEAVGKIPSSVRNKHKKYLRKKWLECGIS
jgi:uncharacterized protein with HEPN domain